MPLYAERHLILVNRPGWQRVGDFEEIKARIAAKAEDIEVFIATTESRHPVLRKKAAKRPTLVMSPSPLGEFRPERGKVLSGRTIDKAEQLRRLRELGIPVPLSEILTPDTKLDPAVWGPAVLLKPSGYDWTSNGKGIALVPTEKLRYRPPEDYPPHHPGRHTPFLVQSFIDTGPCVSAYRVNTLLGAALYCMHTELLEPRAALGALGDGVESRTLATNAATKTPRRRRMADDADVLALAKACHEAYPDVPVMGVDILRDVRDGSLHVLELNTASDTWHISSSSYDVDRVGDISLEMMTGQFGAWDVAADVLIEATRTQAL
jgi:hypothetical protein